VGSIPITRSNTRLSLMTRVWASGDHPDAVMAGFCRINRGNEPKS
jgi:hypothetical protein